MKMRSNQSRKKGQKESGVTSPNTRWRDNEEGRIVKDKHPDWKKGDKV